MLCLQHRSEIVSKRIIPDLSEKGAWMTRRCHCDGDIGWCAAGFRLETRCFASANTRFLGYKIDQQFANRNDAHRFLSKPLPDRSEPFASLSCTHQIELSSQMSTELSLVVPPRATKDIPVLSSHIG